MKRNHKTGFGWMLLGAVLLVAAICLTCHNVWEDRQAGQASENVYEELCAKRDADEEDAPVEGIPLYLQYPEMEMPTVEVDGNLYIGTLEIPALDLSLPVMDEWSYPGLKVAPCRYDGSSYCSDMVIVAHNYMRHFGQLKYLGSGDSVFFTDVDGNLFTYEVGELVTVEPMEVEEVVNSGWDLTLVTCTYGGKARLAVRCREIKTDSRNLATRFSR